jgi:transposase, IS5 family
MKPLCDSAELPKFRVQIGADDISRIFEAAVLLQNKATLEETVNIDTTGQEKNITYPTDGKLAIKIINRLRLPHYRFGLEKL